MKVIPNARNIASAKERTPSDAVFCLGAYNAPAIAKIVKTNVVIIFKIMNPIISSSFSLPTLGSWLVSDPLQIYCHTSSKAFRTAC